MTSTEGITTEINLWTEIERVQRMGNRTVRTFDATSVMCTHLQTRSKKEKHLPLSHCKFPQTTTVTFLFESIFHEDRQKTIKIGNLNVWVCLEITY